MTRVIRVKAGELPIGKQLIQIDATHYELIKDLKSPSWEKYKREHIDEFGKGGAIYHPKSMYTNIKALGKLVCLYEAWINDASCKGLNCFYRIIRNKGEDFRVEGDYWKKDAAHSLFSFPDEITAKDFLAKFKDLFEAAKPII